MNGLRRLVNRVRRAGEDDRGQVTAFVVIAVAGLWLLAGIVVDGGLALASKARALDVAQEAARTGAQQLDVGRLRESDRVRLLQGKAEQAAMTYVAGTRDKGSATVRGDRVTVRVTHRQPTQVLQLIGVSELTVSADASVRAQRAALAGHNEK
ncbi:pilus assembly protein TadG-related protein [Streptomyces sp. NPDC050738]|uniref:pilus assembly protein TadG-related protein n=1 Tax=Streptomyces sp. NPDC050738 TaxID=3154744 RepID=UPI003432840B